MTRHLEPKPLTATAFAPYGDVIEVSGEPTTIINQGMCDRYNDLARLDFTDGRPGLSLFDAKARHFPYVVDMLERHPKGSQAFVPITQVPFLVVVADDDGGKPTNIQAFVTRPGQSINLHPGTWHGVLTPIEAPGQYVVIDRIGSPDNLEEHWLDDPLIVPSA